MRAFGATIGIVASAALALGAPALGGYGLDPPDDGMGGMGMGGGGPKNVNANGNAVTGGLNFDPATVKVRVGEVVKWTNTDAAVPHTATEDHGLWDLDGDYGIPPYTGFGPGESVERPFEAGTHNYYCEVHPDDMRAVVRVPVTVMRRRGGDHPRLRVAWAPGPPDEGRVYDVQRRQDGAWQMILDGTERAKATFPGKHGAFRARLRLADDPSQATDWSPPRKR